MLFLVAVVLSSRRIPLACHALGLIDSIIVLLFPNESGYRIPGHFLEFFSSSWLNSWQLTTEFTFG